MKFVAIEGEAIYVRTFTLTTMPYYTRAFKILEKCVTIDNIKGLFDLLVGIYLSTPGFLARADMCRLNSHLAKIMRPRKKTCVPIRVILRFRELWYPVRLPPSTEIIS